MTYQKVVLRQEPVNNGLQWWQILLVVGVFAGAMAWYLTDYLPKKDAELIKLHHQDHPPIEIVQ